MIKTYDGTSFKRLGGKPGDKSPAVGVKRPRTLYTAVGGETSINLSATSPAISYLPGNAQISVKRSSGGALISGFDFFELTSSSIGFPSTDPLVAGEVVEIIQDVVITAVMAAVVRPDAFTATGVLGQTLITADFSWAYNLNPSKGIGAVEVCLHGLSLTRGVDYTEVNLSVANTNQITLVDPLVGGENIQILPLYQALDTSAAATSFNGTQIASIQAGLSAGTQAFVDTTSLISVPNTTIVGRAKIVDITNDLRASFGVERVQTQQIVQLQNEFGPNGEPVWSAVNDDRGLIRFVGGWSNYVGGDGELLFSSTTADYIEVTFYGTGINFLVFNDVSVRDHRATVDGGTEGSNLLPASGSSILSSRNYSHPIAVNAASGLTLGLHTVKLRNAGVNNFNIYGAEILNTNSTTSLNINPGSAYISGQKYQALTSQSVAYAASVTGTRGGRVVQYLKADGTIGQTFQAVNAASAFLTSADHTNEEMVRQYSWREFGAGRSDDFSQGGGSDVTLLGTRAFTLDDGTTTLVALNPYYFKGATSLSESVGPNGIGDFITITFVGTGLDIVCNRGQVPGNSYTVTVDGAAIATAVSGSTLFGNNNGNTVKIVSGLPYSSHTVKITMTATGVVAAFSHFKVYQPKKPSIPTSAIELADFNVMANYVANTTAGLETIAQGVVRKTNSREMTYVEGTGSIANWTISAAVPSSVVMGFETFSANLNAYMEYTFFGTGFDLRYGANTNRSTNITVTVDGLPLTVANFPALSTSAYGGGSYSAPTLSQNSASTSGSGFQANGLPLGLHKVRFTQSATATSSTYLTAMALDIICPIYSAKSNTTYDQQNTLPVGSNSLSDNRKTSLIKDSALQKKNISQAIGVASSPTTTSGAFIPMPDMSITHLNTTGRIKISWSGLVTPSIANTNINTIIYVDGTGVSLIKAVANGAGYLCEASDIYYMPISPGTHKIDIYWSTNGGTATANSNLRSLLVEEI